MATERLPNAPIYNDHKRERKLTPKAMEEKLQRLISQRKSKMTQLVIKMKEIDNMKKNGEHVDKVEQEILHGFFKLYEEFTQLNDEVMQLLPADEVSKDQINWYEPKAASIKGFVFGTESWIKAQRDRLVVEDEIGPQDSVSEVAERS